MSASSIAFYNALNAYLRHFKDSPPAWFVNAKVSEKSLLAKIEVMQRAVATDTRIPERMS